MLLKKVKVLFHPERYHGWGKNSKYFEGWYYKVITADERYAFAFIPGIAMDKDGNKQAFVQILDGKNYTAEYHAFPAEQFSSSSHTFETQIENNLFTQDVLELNLPSTIGKLMFSNHVPWPNKWYSPGIMGPFSFVPLMECYHGILSMDHEVSGQLTINDQIIDFDGGRGYMEKDWGHSFPSAYIWMQSNHFSLPGISFKASVAKIPWLGSSFVGFIAGLYFNNRLIQFTTYNGTTLQRSYVDERHVIIQLKNRKHILDIQVERSSTTELASPIHGFMEGRISESMTSNIYVTLTDRKTKNIIFKDKGQNAGLEVAGKISEIVIPK